MRPSPAGSADAPSASSAMVNTDATSPRSALLLPTAHRPLPTSSWHRIESDVNGEWNYYLILDQFLSAPAESKQAAAGWAGDRYAVYEGPEGQVFLAQVAVWDTNNDAREFFDAYVKRTELRYPGATRLDPSGQKPETRNSKLETGNAEPNVRNIYSWATNEGSVVMELRGPRVVILEGIPAGTDVDALRKLL